jgi:DnaK suppressor protein
MTPGERTVELYTDMLERLHRLRAKLLAAAATGADASQIVELDQARVGRLSRMDALQAQAMSQASDQRREAMLRKITAAIGRIENDSYGACRSCDEAISRKRLEFDPTSLLCIDCASAAESQ